MRRRIGTCLLAVLMLGALMVPALAAEPTGDTPGIYDVTASKSTVTPKDKDGKVVEAKDGFYANAVQLAVTVDADPATYYLILALNDGSSTPTKDNIAYIDQKGEATFNVYPGDLSSGKTYNVYLSSDKAAQTPVASFKYYEGKATDIRYGDLDGKGDNNMKDVQMALRAYSGKLTLTDEQLVRADIAKKDGVVGMNDVLLVLRIAGGKVDPFTLAKL